MKLCVLGAGSLGSAIGGTLALDGHEVYLVGRPAHVEAMEASGLVLVEENGERVAPVHGRVSASGIGVCDLVIVLSKAYDTEEVMRGSEELIGPETMVLSLQNGLGNEELLSEIVGAEHVIGGKTYIGGMVLEPGRVSSTVVNKNTVIGELDGSITPRIEAVAAAFEHAGMHTIISENIMGVIWDKLLVNVATGAVCGITQLPYGWIYQSDFLEQVGVAAVQEGMDVAHAAGIELSFDHAIDSWNLAGAGLPFDFKPSILQSLDKLRRTEIDVINGAVVREGAKLGVPTPVNATLTALVKGRELHNAEYEKAE